MATLSDLARMHTGLGAASRAHLRRLVGSWGPLADLSFSDLVLCAPVSIEGSGEMVILGQIRPTTAQTLFVDDLVGVVSPTVDVPGLGPAMTTGKTTSTETVLDPGAQQVRVLSIPVHHEGRMIAAVVSYRRIRESHAPSALEEAYEAVFVRLVQMLNNGTFPFPFEGAITEETPRVGDGTLILDRDSRVDFSSPNAVSALHRIGYKGRIVGRKIEDLGFDGDVVASAYRLKVPVIEEIQRSEAVTILARILPLIEMDQVTGAIVLVRDVSGLRRRDRLLVSRDTTIREIHHRVKNNLQTVSSLLRLQGRRLESGEAKAAIEESVRRIGAIAVVHQMLAVSGGDQVVFREVVEPIMNTVRSTLVSNEVPLSFRIIGEGPTLSASQASSLAVVVTELLQNAVEHGFPPGFGGGSITVELVTGPSELVVRVHDDGVGVGPGFDVDAQSGLGLTIIRSLVTGELQGELSIDPARGSQRGTVAQVLVRLDDEAE
ncbi:MAG: sensor histidine kinase [Acidimicrobiia bacterium]|nr:sensor histidine kinase [Acidimicrobiia bacterium]